MDPEEELEEGLLDTSPGDLIQTDFITDIPGNGLLNPADLIQTDFITDISLPAQTDISMGDQNPHQYQVGLDKLGNFLKTGLTYGATAGLYGINPLLAVAAHTPGSFFRAGAKKLGGGDLDKWDKLDLATGFISPTPLSGFISRFVDIVFPGTATLDDDPDTSWKISP